MADNPTVLILNFTMPAKGSLIAIANSLRARKWNVTEISRDSASWQNDACKFIRQQRPDYCICFQRIYQYENAVICEIERAHVRMLFADFGIGLSDGHYGSAIFDPLGENATSSIAHGGFERALQNRVQLTATDATMPKVAALAEELIAASARAQVPRDLPPDFVFLCLQRTADKVLRYDSHFGDSSALALEFGEVAGERAVIKPHPLDGKFAWKPTTGGKLIGRGDLGPASQDITAYLIGKADKMVVVNSTTAYLRMALGLPVAMLGRGWASGNGVAIEARTISHAVNSETKIDPDRQRRFVATLLSRQRTIGELQDPEYVGDLISFFHEAAEWEPYSHRQHLFVPSPIARPQHLPRPKETGGGGCCGKREGESLGYLYVAMGERYWKAFEASARSLRSQEPSAAIAVVTNCEWPLIQPAAKELELRVIPVDFPDHENRMVKTRLNFYTPFARTIYIDADTQVMAPLNELFRHLDRFDLCVTYDPLRPTVGERAVRNSPRLQQSDSDELLRLCGAGATMPQWGFFAFWRGPVTDEFFERAHKHWISHDSVGDSAAFTRALWESDVRVEYLIPEAWQENWTSSPAGKAKLFHAFGLMSAGERGQTLKQFMQESKRENRPQIITTVYIPETVNERYPDTAGLVKRCMDQGLRGRRIVCIDKAKPEFFQWAKMRGHTVIEIVEGKPPRMSLLLQKALKHVETDLVWTIEQDVIVDAATARRAEWILRGLPENCACLFLRPVNEQGEWIKPFTDEKNYYQELPDCAGIFAIHHAPFCATVWRKHILEQINFDKMPVFHKCDMIVSDALWNRAFLPCGSKELTAVHYPHSSYKSEQTSGTN